MTVTATDQTLDRRRDRAGTAGAAAERAEAAVTDLDNQLRTIADLTVQQQQSLRNAVDEAARLKRSLKAARQRRAELLKARKKAAVKAGKARDKARAAEAKYDKQLLADMIRREKERDRAASAPDPQPEKQTASTATARRTAARKTARS
ncbi:hypothetical protein COUCH_36620 [Couchioplanes caeruleus]|uniref:hypothetical protein n=1 Tax=Couchioplanes caeruleus TaxID=56438 RepID=UPI0020BDD6B8|nr:hypothetical protein [Couchioplanes caeruleus]UQU64421.1 hypothetical protein COUCH_36620 [Couchioplanes caeruleus]